MTISIVLVIGMAVLFSCGIYLLLERSMTRMLLGFLLLGNGTNLLLITMSGGIGLAPITDEEGVAVEDYADPLPQAFVLTAIVITFAVSAFLLALIYRAWRLANEDDVEVDEEDVAIATRGVANDDDTVDDEQQEDSEFSGRAADPIVRRAADDAAGAADVAESAPDRGTVRERLATERRATERAADDEEDRS